MAKEAAKSNIVLGDPESRTEKALTLLLVAYLLGWITLPSALHGKVGFGGPFSAIILFTLLWALPRFVKFPAPKESIPSDLLGKIDDLRIKLGFKRIVVAATMKADYPQATIMNGFVNLTAHQLTHWPQEAIMWQIEAELRAVRDMPKAFVLLTLFSAPSAGMLLANVDSARWWHYALVLALIVSFLTYVYWAGTLQMYAADRLSTPNEEAKLAAQVALSDPYFYALKLKPSHRPLGISLKWLKRRADRLGIKLIPPTFTISLER